MKLIVQTIYSARKAPPKNICKCQKPQNRTLAGAALPLSPTDQIPSADKIGPNSLGMTSSTQTAVVASSFVFYQARARSARARRACALRALELLLADGTPTVGGGKTF